MKTSTDFHGLNAAAWSEYELLAEWHPERASLDDRRLVACQAMVVVGVVLREVAEAIDVDWGEATDAYLACRLSPIG